MIDAEGKNPDYLLSLVKQEEQRVGQGKLKVFLGMVAGVGKTYAMLQAARQLQVQGVDVVAGIVETHGRKETADLLSGLETLPRRTLIYRGVEFEEFDVDAALTRRPRVLLVDELAHTNVEGCRHKKRYLDVLEILEAGIDVYTTLNVQHIESRVDTVHEITKVTVHETVPDSVLDRADEVVLIDLGPEELLKRLSEGRIYPEDSAEIASTNFFKKVNLTALREIALRVAAERVDRELREYKTLHGIESAWKAGNRLMVAIFASPYSEVLIRWTRRVADVLDATWIGAYVEGDEEMSETERQLLAKNIALVHQLGGEVISTREDDPVVGLLRIAQRNNVTQIIVGKSQRSSWTNFFRGGSIVQRLMRQSGNIDVYAVATGRALGKKYLEQKFVKKRPTLPWDEMGWVVAIALGTWLFARGVEPFIGYLAVGIVFLLAVSISGLFLARFSVMVLALGFFVIHNYFFIPPIYTFGIYRPEDAMTLAMFFVAAGVIGHLTTRLAKKEKILMSRENRALTLYGLTNDIAAAQSIKEIIDSGINHLGRVIDGEFIILLRDGKKSEALAPRGRGTFQPNAKDRAVATWVFQNGKIAGRGTDTLSSSAGTYIPIIGRSGALGVLGVNSPQGSVLDPDQITLIEIFLHQIAVGIERESYQEQVRGLLIAEETQKLYKSLLDSVSHELKTPLAAIKGSASALLDPKTISDRESVEKLGAVISESAERLQRVVDNLLDMTRIESGMLLPKREPCDVSDILGTVLRELEGAKAHHNVKISIPPDLPPIDCDPVLIDQALANIVHNAFMYTSPDSDIEISASVLSNERIAICVRDHGPGLPKDNPQKVLDKFFRATPKSTGGIGLGLSIAKGFVEAQGGTLRAYNHELGGAVFCMDMPMGASYEQ